jgi:hypothetical protein
MKHRMTARSRGAALLLWSCVALFGARVVGQFEALVAAPDWLPDMDAWYSGLLPYHLLLPLQIALLMVMAVVAWNRRVRTGRFAWANPRISATLRGLAITWFLAMAARLAFNLAGNGADFWRAGAIPVACHWVLALFLLVSVRPAESVGGLLRIPAEEQDEDDEADDIPHGDVPALTQPLTHGLGFREQVGYRDAG